MSVPVAVIKVKIQGLIKSALNTNLCFFLKNSRLLGERNVFYFHRVQTLLDVQRNITVSRLFLVDYLASKIRSPSTLHLFL